MAVICVLTASAQSIYDIKVKDDAGKDVSLVQFPQFDKIEVNGPNEHPLYALLKTKDGEKADIKWNFTKFLVTRDGRILKRYEPADKIAGIEADLSAEVRGAE